MALKKEFDLHSNNYYRKSLLDIKGLECSKEFWNVDSKKYDKILLNNSRRKK